VRRSIDGAKGAKVRIWNGFIWLRKRSRSGFLRQRIPRLHNTAFPQLVYLTVTGYYETPSEYSFETSHLFPCKVLPTTSAEEWGNFPFEQLAVTQMLQRYHDSDYYFHLWHIYWQLVGNKVVASICTSAPFPSRGKHPPLTDVCHIHQPWGCFSKMQGISYPLTSQERCCSKEFVTPPATPVFRVNFTVILETSYEWKQRQCKYNVTLRRVRATIVAVENQEVLHTFECVFVTGIQRAYLSGSTIFFFHTVINGTIFEKGNLRNINCVLRFSLQLLSTTFFILRTKRDMTKNVYWSSCKLPVILLRF